MKSTVFWDIIACSLVCITLEIESYHENHIACLLSHLIWYYITTAVKSKSLNNVRMMQSLYGVAVGRYGEWWGVVTRRVYKQEDHKQTASADTGPPGVIIWCTTKLVWRAESLVSIPLPLRDPAALLQLHSIWCIQVNATVPTSFLCTV